MRLLQMSFSGAVLIIVIVAVRAAAVNVLPKKTFMILWGIALFRLLMPYSVPCACSVYTLLTPGMSVFTDTESEGNAQTVVAGLFPAVRDILYEQQSEKFASLIFVARVLWLIGVALCSLFFASSYFYWRYAFQTSLPIHNDFVKQWQQAHGKRLPVLVRQSDRIAAPLSYGIFRAVILMPKKTDWSNTEQLKYVLMHEYVHICRHDSAFKLISTLALCVHWFNPFVWLMYFLLQCDIELVCDESVIRCFGEQSKRTYANMLIDMEMKKGSPMPLCNHFGKNAIEERIIAIMKVKKTSVATMLLSAVLIAGITVSFATSASAGKVENDYNKTGTVNTDALKIRENASGSASVSGLLPEMQQVMILSEEDGFYHVFVPGDAGLDGWVRKEYVDIDE